MEHFDFIYNLLNQKGVGRVKANKILNSCVNELKGDYVSLDFLIQELSKFLTPHQINAIQDDRIEIKLKPELPSPFFVNRFQSSFPTSLNALNSNCPPVLACFGNVDLFKLNKVGFCGSRKASEKGLDVAQDITKQVAKKNIAVVSGYASGIDQETHYWALKEGGSTIIVLPEGINNFSIKKNLKEVWNWDKVLVVSEYAPNAIWSVSRAMQRNSTIIALSNVMFLIEAKEKGGSIDAGYKTLQMNKPLFAPVYKDMPVEASGNNLLLTKGALPLRKKKETNRANLDKMFKMFEESINTNLNLFE